MRKYSKLWGALFGALAGIAIRHGLLPPELGSSEILSEVIPIVTTGLATWIAPANK